MAKKKVSLKKPIIKMEYESEPIIDSNAEQYYYKSFSGIEVGRLIGITFDCCYFENVQFIGDLSRVEFLDCRFVNCDFSNREIIKGGYYRCEFSETKFIGTVMNNSTMKDILLRTCFMDLISFSDCLVGPIIFNECSLKESYFHKSQFKGIEFNESDLFKVSFSETLLKGVNVAGCIIDGISANPYELKGLIIDKHQAYEFCKYLDIEIE